MVFPIGAEERISTHYDSLATASNSLRWCVLLSALSYVLALLA